MSVKKYRIDPRAELLVIIRFYGEIQIILRKAG